MFFMWPASHFEFETPEIDPRTYSVPVEIIIAQMFFMMKINLI